MCPRVHRTNFTNITLDISPVSAEIPSRIFAGIFRSSSLSRVLQDVSNYLTKNPTRDSTKNNFLNCSRVYSRNSPADIAGELLQGFFQVVLQKCLQRFVFFFASKNYSRASSKYFSKNSSRDFTMNY